ncbi:MULTISPECIES: hypothetical protein [unclassified Variovorax]|uniref:hypothetical protein n=1 Tax=unclassified Variovorax TaxID=663243 RepID=UPI00083984D1|nr:MULTISPECIES: hypothetical protein [unclassified Variovorax]PNG49977.1 hypothetical protein CHC06_05558 [Variovorax sp. B2]PNG50849.1 hypothetical protein CHC07_05463 [Variovorax sp. B4]VTU41717.1 hypothetical protein H6P1_00032 [Variovorax sp. PBL-H6]VTU44588.1 hypothetical protein SRS16P1_00870 [Variovorax sp. SRS16]VTU44633.1 hypothetical protein E5P1_00862 [Variovorax sp. PBL-E5]
MKPLARLGLNTLLVAACTALGGYAFFHVGTSTGVLKRTPEHARLAPTAVTAAVSYLESLGQGEVAVTVQPGPKIQEAAPVEFLFVSASSAVSAADGATVKLEVVGRGPTCEGTYEAGTRRFQTWAEGVTAAAGAQVIADWCLVAAPGTEVAYRTMDQPWKTEAGELEADFATRYIRFLAPGGAPAAIKATALAVCDDDKGCGYLASITVGDDDRQISELVTQGDAELVQARTIADDDEIQAVTVPAHPPAGLHGFHPVLVHSIR